jgi:hypothetical protein
VSVALRRLRFGLATLAGRPRGWFIPHRYAVDVAPPTVYGALLPVFEAATPGMLALLAEAAAFMPEFARFGGAPPNPRFEQDWFPRLDAAIAYTLMRRMRPVNVVEIGSGHSTRVLARAIADGHLTTRLTAIDPAPRADLAGLAIDLVRAPFQKAPRDAVERLGPGDFLMIDSSHVMMPGSDVDLLFNDVMTRLPAGVLVHVHDVFLPDAYPAAWKWREYNEQNALVGPLATGGWKLLWSSHWMATRRASDLARTPLGALPLPAGAFETSVWMERL